MNRPVRLFFVLALFAGATAAASPAASFQTTPAAQGGADAGTKAQILNLKLQAQDAVNAGDKAKARELYRRILQLDPDDALAGRKNDELTKELEQKTVDAKIGVVQQDDQRARDARVKAGIDRAEDALVEAKRTGDAEPLTRARAGLEEAKKYGRADDPRIERLQAQIDEQAAAVRLRFWELWGFIGLVVVAAIVAIVLYVVSGRRVLEMIEGAQMGQVFVLQKESTALGALATEVDWAIDDPLRKISRRHCDVLRQGRRYFLVDSSMNGTFLNGRPLQKGQPALLKRGDEIGLGGVVRLRFR